MVYSFWIRFVSKTPETSEVFVFLLDADRGVGRFIQDEEADGSIMSLRYNAIKLYSNLKRNSTTGSCCKKIKRSGFLHKVSQAFFKLKKQVCRTRGRDIHNRRLHQRCPPIAICTQNLKSTIRCCCFLLHRFNLYKVFIPGKILQP